MCPRKYVRSWPRKASTVCSEIAPGGTKRKKERKAIANLFALHAKEKKVKNKCASATLTFFENLKISFQ